MFSSSKIFFSKNQQPLKVAVQPQDAYLAQGSNSIIGQTSWETSPGYKRSMVLWERSVDGQNWFQETSSLREDGGFSLSEGASLAQSGLKYRSYAYAYERYTYLPNYMDLTNPYEALWPATWWNPNDTSQAGRVVILGEYPGDYAFLFIKGGQFRLDLQFSGSGSDTGTVNSYVSVDSSIGGRLVAPRTPIPAMQQIGGGGFTPAQNSITADFEANPGELMSFNISPNPAPTNDAYKYRFDIQSKTTNVPYFGPRVTSESFTLTVAP